MHLGYFFNYFSMGVMLSFATFLAGCFIIFFIKNNEQYNSNIHRGLHSLSTDATNQYELSRKIIQKHFGIKNNHEVIFTSGTTHGINIVSSGLESQINSSDE